MAGVTHTIQRGVTVLSEAIAIPEAVTAGSAVIVDETIPQNSSDLVLACAFAIAKLKSFFITSNVVMTVKTFNSVTLKETINLTAGQAIQWTLADASLLPLPFASDVTSIKVTTGAVGDGQLRIRAIVDPT